MSFSFFKISSSENFHNCLKTLAGDSFLSKVEILKHPWPFGEFPFCKYLFKLTKIQTVKTIPKSILQPLLLNLNIPFIEMTFGQISRPHYPQ